MLMPPTQPMQDKEIVMVKHTGGCHCGRVKFEVTASSDMHVLDCNCTICAKTAYLHLIVPKEQFKLLEGESSISTYTFNTGVAQHFFCSHCGVKSFYVPRSHPEGISVNARCLDQSTIDAMTIEPINGKEWEKQFPSGRAGEYPR